MPDSGELVGAVLDGRYRVGDIIGKGAMGVVYRGERIHLGRPVAIKVLHDSLPDELAARARFELEAKAMAKLEHPHCVAVLDVGLHDGRPYVVMEMVTGESLRTVLDRGPLDVPRATSIMRQVLSGLAHAHELGIVHRDIKPANLMLGHKIGLGDQVKILDFGLARSMDSTSTRLTGALVLGTPAYMAPEQCRDSAVDARSDLYACGVVLFEMLTGTKPFHSEADDPIEVVGMHLHLMPPKLHDKRPEVDFGPLEVVVARALAKDPKQRYRSATELSDALDAALRGETEPVPSVEPADMDPVAISIGPTVPLDRPDGTTLGMGPSPARAATTPLVGPISDESGLTIPAPFTDEADLATPPPPSELHPTAPASPDALRDAIPFTSPSLPGTAPVRPTPPPRPTPAPYRPPTPPPTVPAGPSTSPGFAPTVPSRPPTAPRAEDLFSSSSASSAPAKAQSPKPNAPPILLLGGAVAGGLLLILIFSRACGGSSTKDAPRDAGRFIAVIDAAPLPVDAAVVARVPPDAAPVDSPPLDAELIADDDPAGQALLKAAERVSANDVDGALAILATAHKEFVANPDIPYMAGRLYFQKQKFHDGIASFREAIRLFPGYLDDPELPKLAVAAFLATPTRNAEIAAFLKKDLGKTVVPFLREASPANARATAELKRF